MSLCRAGVELHGVAEILNRGQPVSLKPQRVGQVVVRGGQVGLEPDSFAEMDDCLVHGPQVDQGRAEVAMACGLIGLEFEGGPISGDGPIKLSERPERRGQSGVVNRRGRLDRDRAAHQCGRPPGISPLERHQPQEMECVGMIRHPGQGRLIQTARPARAGPADGVRSLLSDR